MINIYYYKVNKYRGARDVMVIVVENGHGDTSSNPGRMNPIILPPAMSK